MDECRAKRVSQAVSFRSIDFQEMVRAGAAGAAEKMTFRSRI